MEATSKPTASAFKETVRAIDTVNQHNDETENLSLLTLVKSIMRNCGSR